MYLPLQTIFFKGFYNGPDDSDHLHAAFGQFKKDINWIKQEKFEFPTCNGTELWEVEFFLIRDNNFLSHICGHQGLRLNAKIKFKSYWKYLGSACKKSYLWCLVPLADLRNPTPESMFPKVPHERRT